MSAFFTSALCPQLLRAIDDCDDQPYLVAVLPSAQEALGTECSLEQVVDSTASLVFLRKPPPDEAESQLAFVKRVLAFADKTAEKRVVAWADDPALFPTSLENHEPTPYLTIACTAGGTFTGGSLKIVVGPTLSVQLLGSLKVTVKDNTLYLGDWAAVDFQGQSAPRDCVKAPAALPCQGWTRGCLTFKTWISQISLAEMGWGLLFGIPPAREGADPTILSAPLALPSTASWPGFLATFDPANPGNVPGPSQRRSRTALTFLGTDLSNHPTTLQSAFTTPSGSDTVVLTPVTDPAKGRPARLILRYPPTPVSSNEYFSLAPDGDFTLTLASGNTAPAAILCGLQGTEYLTFHPGSGDRLRFIADRPAYAPNFPLRVASPVASPAGSTLLDPTWLTSWAMLIAGAPNRLPCTYVAQPPGFRLFGNDPVIHTRKPNLLGPAPTPRALPVSPTHEFPLIPYSLVVSGKGSSALDATAFSDFETQVIAPTRQTAIAADTSMQGPRTATTGGAGSDGAASESLANYATPSGYLLTVDTAPGAGGGWRSLLLANLTESNQKLAFLNPGATLRAAFQAGSMMLVDANGLNLGTKRDTAGFGEDPSVPCAEADASVFANTLTIDGWKLSAAVGTGSTYGDYSNVLIIKAVSGPLYDPEGKPEDNLVSNPTRWSMADTFAAPLTGGKASPDSAQLTNLAEWLQGYFRAAATDPDTAHFAEFNRLARDPTWTGLLLLRGRIEQPPQGLSGILAGLRDPSRFTVHHLAVPVTPLTNPSGQPAPGTPTGPQVTQSSAVSGLIYYLDPDADPSAPAAPIATDPDRIYDFTTLSLKVRFANSAVQEFSSYTQLTTHSLFGSKVDGVDTSETRVKNRAAIVLSGTYHVVDGQPCYQMSSTDGRALILANNVLRRVMITNAAMSTVSADAKGDTVSAFTLNGFLDFGIVPGETSSGSIDLLGFGKTPNSPPQSPEGLAFQNLRISLTFPTAAPAQRTFSPDYGTLRFDLDRSTVRPDSLVADLQLRLRELRVQLDDPATPPKTPTQLGYLTVVTAFPAARLGSAWNGLVFDLDLGTPGRLAASAGLTAQLLLAWSPGDQGRGGGAGVQVGLRLPGTAAGAQLMQLQNVLKLSIGQIQLAYDSQSRAYLLLLDQISLSILGLLKFPPNGTTSFSLFGGNNRESGLAWYAMYNNKPRKGGPRCLPTRPT